MYKNQKQYFSKPIIPEDVIEKSVIKIKKSSKPKKNKIKTRTKVVIKEKSKGVKQMEREKLMKTYGKNNNMISLLILLLKRGDDKKDKKQYKPKSTYKRGGYKKQNQYQTRSQVDKERNKGKTKKQTEDFFKNTSKDLKEADKETSEVLKKAKLKKIDEDVAKFLTDLDYETYGKGLSPEDRQPRIILELKKTAEESVLKAEEERKLNLKKAQNKGRDEAKLKKDKIYTDFVDGIVFTDKMSKAERSVFFDTFKADNPDFTKAKKGIFDKFLDTKYKIFRDSLKTESIEDVNKRELKIKRDNLIKQFVEDKNVTSISKKQSQEFIQEFKANNPDLEIPSKAELTKYIVVGDSVKKPRRTKLDVAIDSLFVDEPDNTLQGANKRITVMNDFITKKDREKITKLQSKSNKSEEEIKELERLEKQIQEADDYKSSITRKRDILQEFMEWPDFPKKLKSNQLPDIIDVDKSDEDYEMDLYYILGKATGDIPETDSSSSSEEEFEDTVDKPPPTSLTDIISSLVKKDVARIDI